MPSECKVPSIFGPTPEISLRSSAAAGRSMPAGRFLSSSDGLAVLAAGCLVSGDLNAAAGSALAFGPLRGFETASTSGEAWLAFAAEWRGALTLAAFSAAGETFTDDGVFSAGLVSGASVFGLLDFDGATGPEGAGAAGACDTTAAGTAAGAAAAASLAAFAAALASLSRVDFRLAFSLFSVVSPDAGSEPVRPFCGPGLTSAPLPAS